MSPRRIQYEPHQGDVAEYEDGVRLATTKDLNGWAYGLEEQAGSYTPTDPGVFVDYHARAGFIGDYRTLDEALEYDYEMRQAQATIRSGAGNDDRAMERALDIEEKVMATRAQLERQQRRIDEQLAEIDLYGEDVYEDDAVLLFKYTHNAHGTIYTYAALKIKGLWYLSGQSSGSLTWAQLIEFWMRGAVLEMWEAAGWEQVI